MSFEGTMALHKDEPALTPADEGNPAGEAPAPSKLSQAVGGVFWLVIAGASIFTVTLLALYPEAVVQATLGS